MYFDWTYLVFVIPALIISAIASMRVNSAYNKYSRVSLRNGYKGSEIARKMLDMNGLYDVRVEKTNGHLSDHYDPRGKVIRLSEAVYEGNNTAAAGVAAHEAGHAVQHANGYFPLQIRNFIIPLTNIGSRLSFPLILLGILFSNSYLYFLAYVGIALFGLTIVFQLITLPVEFNASHRALETLRGGLIAEDEIKGTKRVLSAAAMTYVAALIVAVMQMLRLLTLVSRRRR